jgi:AcrR family transcriptional regulator
MQPAIPAADSSPTTEQRLIDAALEVFSREGIGKATTREIAKVAGVNEVTLFRRFQNKQGLLEAVLKQAFLPISQETQAPLIQNGASLPEVVRYFAEVDFERKRRNTGLMRVLVAESHRMGALETEILTRIFLPWKQKLAAQFREALNQGLIRPDSQPEMIVDQLVAMLFVGALRIDSGICKGYDASTYLDSCVDLILRGISPTQP